MTTLQAWFARVAVVVAILIALTAACGDQFGIWDRSHWDDATWAPQS